jgi:hypothetical protein
VSIIVFGSEVEALFLGISCTESHNSLLGTFGWPLCSVSEIRLCAAHFYF